MANVVKFGGIAIANIQKIFGVPKSSISKIMGSTISGYTYATLNPADKSSYITLSNGNLTATATSSGWRSVRSTLSKNSGRWYFEITADNIYGSWDGQNALFGIADLNMSVDNYVGSSSGNGWGWWGNSVQNQYYHAGSASTATVGIVNGDVVMIAFDVEAGKLWFGKNGTWNASGDPAAGTNEIFSGLDVSSYYACISLQSPAYVTANFGATAFSHAVPAGFTRGLPQLTYATWNSSDKSSLLTLSGSNLIATHDSSDSWGGARANIGKSSGKWYWEYTMTSSLSNEYAVVGVGNASQVLNDHVGNSTNGWGYYQTDGTKVYNDSLTSYGNSFTTGDKVGVALDMDNGKVWFSKNGTWQNNKVKSLLHLNGTDGSTTFTDESGRAWTYGGNAQLDTADKKFDTASLLLDGNGDYIKTTSSLTDFYFGSGNFTIDFWTKLNQSKEQVFVGFKPSSGNCLGIGCDASNNLYGYIYQSTTGYYLMSTLNLTADGNWHHVAFLRDGNTLRMFLDGTAASETTAVTGVTMNNPDSQIVIGAAQGADSYYVNGWIDEVRISAGVARWTGTFSVPTVAYKYSPPADGIDEAFSGLSGTIYPIISMIQHSTVITANFGSSKFSYVPPAGFIPGLYS